jgi:hypothetical protein
MRAGESPVAHRRDAGPRALHLKFLDVLSMLLHKYRERFGELGLKTEMKQATIALLDEIATVGAVLIFVYLPILDEITRDPR